jgi:magnesium chelatase subunit D
MEAVKGAVIQLLTDAYQKRDRVALVAARGPQAEVLLPPTSSVDLANQRLADLPTGGRTPLADGLRLGIEIVEQARRIESIDPLLVLVSDGRANVSLGRGDPLEDARTMACRVAECHIPALVIDTEDGRLRLGVSIELSAAMGADYICLDDLQAGALVAAIRGGGAH